MRAVVSSPDGPILSDLQEPAPGPDDVLVRVRAAALNRADLANLKGAAHAAVAGAAHPLRHEWAPEIVETGANVTAWRKGDRVMAAGGGAFADFTIGHARRIYAMPEGLAFAEAAALPVALQTMHDAIAVNGQLQPGQSVLIQGASSGVGLMGLQIAKALGASPVIGSSTSPARRARLTEFGADLAIDVRDENWVKQVLDATNGKGDDLIVDQLAGPYVNANFRAARIGGRIVNVGRLAGMSGDVDFDLHALRRIAWVGVTFRTRSAAEVERIIALTSNALMPHLAAGALRLPIDSVRPLAGYAGALADMAANRHFGKIILDLG